MPNRKIMINSIRGFHLNPRVLMKFKSGLANPVEDIQPFLQVPLVKESDFVFKPSLADVEAVQNLFRGSNQNQLVTFKGAASYTDLPNMTLPEIVFIGRSNVGKSSLIKSLLFDPSHVKISISKKPGHTTAVKIYTIKQRFSLVDVPGFGFNMPSYFTESVEAYLQHRKNLVRTFLLIDSCAGLTDVDKIGIEMLEEFRIPYSVVLTKIDKNKVVKLYQNIEKLNAYRESNMPGCLPQPFLVSAKADAGIGFLRAFIAHVAGIFDYNS